MRAEFTDNLITGNKTIDEQHKELISKINGLLEAVEGSQGQAAAMRTLNFLNDYVVYHFDAEEKLQEEVSYPGIREHKAKHAEFKKAVEELHEMLEEEEGPSEAFVAAVKKNVVDWLFQHIKNKDQTLATFIQNKE